MLHNQAKAKCRFDESEPMVPFSEPWFLLTPYLEATRGLAVTRIIRRHEPEFPRLAAERTVDCEVSSLQSAVPVCRCGATGADCCEAAKVERRQISRVAASRVIFRL
jgi:hypothetical protein